MAIPYGKAHLMKQLFIPGKNRFTILMQLPDIINVKDSFPQVKEVSYLISHL